MLAETCKRPLWIALCLFIALALRAPLIEAHSRYFYHEDDAHHFNRTIEMVQQGELNPHYFNKPALHFYLRIPIVLGSVAWLKHRGEISSVHDVKTRDPFGLAGYAFAVSHPSVLAWNRAWSVCMSLLAIALTCSLAGLLSIPLVETVAAALLVGVSPEFLRNSDIVGVDIQMALLCVLTTVVGVYAVQKRYSRKLLLACGIAAGLAGATKYNAAPAALVPLVVALYRDRTRVGLLLSLVTPALGFLLGAPYSLLSFDEFWQGLSYEIWHYRISGHVGHTAEPGFDQALFYLKWLASDGVGLTASALAGVGLVAALRQRSPALITFLAFPVAYMALMVAQKTNFTRNMVPVVPFVALLAALGVSWIASGMPQRIRALVVAALATAIIAQPTARAVEITVHESLRLDSRDILAEWLTHQPKRDEVALDGALQLPPSLSKKRGVVVVDLSSGSLAQLVQQGFTTIAVPSSVAQSTDLPFAVEKDFPGEPINKHEPRNPAITILRVTPDALRLARKSAPATLRFSSFNDHVTPDCGSNSENSCWLQHYSTSVIVPAGVRTLDFQAMSPWRGQELRIESSDGRFIQSLSFTSPGEWKKLSIDLPVSSGDTQRTLIFTITDVHTPEDQGFNEDSRRLGVALQAQS